MEYGLIVSLSSASVITVLTNVGETSNNTLTKVVNSVP